MHQCELTAFANCLSIASASARAIGPVISSGKLPIERFQAEEVLSDIERRYGFIRPDAGERDIFAHRDECDIPAGEEIRIGDRVSYEIGADRRPGKKPRLCALNVRFVADKDEKQAPGMYGGIEESSTGAPAEQLKALRSDGEVP